MARRRFPAGAANSTALRNQGRGTVGSTGRSLKPLFLIFQATTRLQLCPCSPTFFWDWNNPPRRKHGSFSLRFVGGQPLQKRQKLCVFMQKLVPCCKDCAAALVRQVHTRFGSVWCLIKYWPSVLSSSIPLPFPLVLSPPKVHTHARHVSLQQQIKRGEHFTRSF